MKREELEFVLKDNNYMEGGIKEACVKVRDYLNSVVCTTDVIHSSSSVTSEEFVDAVMTLMAFSFTHYDTVPERWYCDTDCHYLTSDLFCPGECNLDKKSKKLCPYFSDESLI